MTVASPVLREGLFVLITIQVEFDFRLHPQRFGIGSLFERYLRSVLAFENVDNALVLFMVGIFDVCMVLCA